MLVTDDTFVATMERLEPIRDWTVDTETSGLGMDDRLCGVSVRANGVPVYFPFRHLEGPNLSQHQLHLLVSEMQQHVITGFNVSGFDTRFLRRDGLGWVVTRDVMLLAFLLNENEPRQSGYGMESLANKYLGREHTRQQRAFDELLTSRLLTKGDVCRLPAALVAPYACEDVELPDKLLDFFTPHLERQELREVWCGVSEYGQLMGLMQERGIPVDTDRTARELASARELLGETAMAIYEREGRVVHVGSPKKAAEWLGVSTTKEDYLQTWKDSQPDVGWKVDLLLKYRKLQRAIGSYYRPMLEEVDLEGRIHPSIVLHGTVTGRPAFWGGRGRMNPLALPRDTETYHVKDCLVAPHGQLWLQADYRNAEMRLACHYGNETRMGKLLEANANIHTVTSEDLAIPYQSAKRINFSVIYGVGPPTLATNLHVSESVAAGFLDKYHGRYPGFRRLYKEADRMAARRGYIRMWTGRRRHYNRGWKITPTHKASDHLVQGGVNELLRVRQTQLHHELPEVEQILQVYDSAMMLIPEDSVEHYKAAVREVMTDRQFSVTMAVDVSVGKTLNLGN